MILEYYFLVIGEQFSQLDKYVAPIFVPFILYSDSEWSEKMIRKSVTPTGFSNRRYICVYTDKNLRKIFPCNRAGDTPSCGLEILRD